MKGDKRMEKNLILANKIMEEANCFGNWGFEIKTEGNLINVESVRKVKMDEQDLHIVYQIDDKFVKFIATLEPCEFDRQKAIRNLEEMDAPFTVYGTEGEMLMLAVAIPYQEFVSHTALFIRIIMPNLIETLNNLQK